MCYVKKVVELLEVRIDFSPLCHFGHDIECYELISHFAEVLIALVELGILLGCSLGNFVVAAGGIEGGLHSHHDVVVFSTIYIGTCREAERLAAHHAGNHLDGEL